LELLRVLLIGIPTLAVLILIHEVGHFWAGRWMKVRIDEFGFGMPPKILTLFRRNEVEYTLNWIPLGGFVRFAGEEDPTVKDGLAQKKPWRRAIVLTAGAFMNMLLGFLLFTGLVMYGRPEMVSDRLGIYRVDPGSPAEAAGIQPGDVVVAINGKKVTSFGDLAIETTLNRGYTVTLALERDGQAFTADVFARRDGEYDDEREGPMGVALEYYEAPVILTTIYEGGPGEKAGLRVDDLIVAIDGQPVRNSVEFRAYLDSHFDETVTLSVQRDGVDLPPIEVENPLEMELKGQEGLVSLELRPLYVDYVRWVLRRYALGPGLVEGWRQTAEAAVLVPRTLAGLFRGSVPISDVSGPVGMVDATARVAREAGFYGVLTLAAIISVNLGLVNMLPLPAFDGGRLIFAFLEWIRRGKRISPEKEGLVHFIGFLLMLALFIVLTFNDIVRLFGEGL
jgi:regulator of sigma E protease